MGATGCIDAPELKPDIVGSGDLASAGDDRLPYPSASELPRLAVSGSGTNRGNTVRHYRVGLLDEVVIIVVGRPDLGSQVPTNQSDKLRISQVQEDGTINLPFLEPVKVVGLSTLDIQSLVRARYAKVVDNPQVETKIYTCGSQNVNVEGAVKKPGVKNLCVDRVTVSDLLTAAGGLRDNADTGRGLLVRKDRYYRVDYREAQRGRSPVQDVILKDGDLIFFPDVSERVVYVFGAVGRQGAHIIPPDGMTLLQLLSKARGVDLVSADIRGVFLIRTTDKGTVTYKISIAEVLQGPDLAVISGDRVFVANTQLSRWSQWWRQALPFSRALRGTGSLP